ncbi:hypothetical protein DTO271D3_2346 [Paecilomyces variotii]|nr:hypothetical protein DTO271D3_2346 [Paecilomyces variotii]
MWAPNNGLWTAGSAEEDGRHPRVSVSSCEDRLLQLLEILISSRLRAIPPLQDAVEVDTHGIPSFPQTTQLQFIISRRQTFRLEARPVSWLSANDLPPICDSGLLAAFEVTLLRTYTIGRDSLPPDFPSLPELVTTITLIRGYDDRRTRTRNGQLARYGSPPRRLFHLRVPTLGTLLNLRPRPS